MVVSPRCSSHLFRYFLCLCLYLFPPLFLSLSLSLFSHFISPHVSVIKYWNGFARQRESFGCLWQTATKQNAPTVVNCTFSQPIQTAHMIVLWYNSIASTAYITATVRNSEHLEIRGISCWKCVPCSLACLIECRCTERDACLWKLWMPVQLCRPRRGRGDDRKPCEPAGVDGSQSFTNIHQYVPGVDARSREGRDCSSEISKESPKTSPSYGCLWHIHTRTHEWKRESWCIPTLKCRRLTHWGLRRAWWDENRGKSPRLSSTGAHKRAAPSACGAAWSNQFRSLRGLLVRKKRWSPSKSQVCMNAGGLFTRTLPFVNDSP